MSDSARRDAAREAEAAARASYGKLLAILSWRLRDITAAEDALAEAFAAALVQWPRDGVPGNPAAWLLTVARRSSGHSTARQRTAQAAAGHLQLLHEERTAVVGHDFGDQRLALMFVCAHPAIESDAQAPLMLQAILGLDAARIATSFLVSGATMGQRLARANRKIRDAGIAFEVPDPSVAASRVEGVLAAIYVDNWFTLNFSIAYTIENHTALDGTRLRFAINNLFDRDPPLADETYGFYSDLHNARGRVFHVELRKTF